MIMTAVALLLGMILCMLLGVPYIDFLRKKTIGQYVLDVAPQTHAKKQGTPTTGGIFIVVAVITASLVTLLMEQKSSTTSLIILITLFFYTLAGFQDDFLKIKGHENKGLSAGGKFARQVAIALLPAIYATLTMGTSVQIGGYIVDFGWFYPLLAVFIITGASNAYNLTDGLDGLASSTGIFAFLACAVIALLVGYTEVAIISAAVCGALIGFLRYNKPKAQVFMGDTGSLAIGGLLGTIAVVGKFEVPLIFLAGVFIIETLSVIIQIASFKLFKRRVFKMAPIHHHFELMGWSEKKIVFVFAFVSMLCSIFAVAFFVFYARGFSA